MLLTLIIGIIIMMEERGRGIGLKEKREMGRGSRWERGLFQGKRGKGKSQGVILRKYGDGREKEEDYHYYIIIIIINCINNEKLKRMNLNMWIGV